VAAHGLLSCGDVDVNFNEDLHDGQGGSLRNLDRRRGADPTLDPSK
jgi:hypothetical protein